MGVRISPNAGSAESFNKPANLAVNPRMRGAPGMPVCFTGPDQPGNLKKRREKIMKKLEKITGKIREITADKSQAVANYTYADASVQAELRLSAEWTITAPVDQINYPRDLSGENRELWHEMANISWDIANATKLKSGRKHEIVKINAKTKNGPAQRIEAKNSWLIESGKQFLADYREATKKSNLVKIRNAIAALQSQQKSLLPKLREKNSEYLAVKKTAREEQKTKNTESLKSGKFWEADTETLKLYFHPPFDKNYLADVSEKWRAALFLECESVSYKRYSGDWGHKLAGTEHGYLCGIDDNGDEWGHECHVSLSRDDFGDCKFDATVEEAMCDLFTITQDNLKKCTRQGDLLFCPTKICKTDSHEHCRSCGKTADQHTQGGYCYYQPHIHKAPIMEPESEWIPRESHIITSPTLRHNGVYFAADNEITVSHTSHTMVTLPAGEYRLYMSQVADPVD